MFVKAFENVCLGIWHKNKVMHYVAWGKEGHATSGNITTLQVGLSQEIVDWGERIFVRPTYKYFLHFFVFILYYMWL